MLKPSLNWLLVTVPVVAVLRYLHPEAHTWLFLLSCIAIIPLAGIMGHATEQIAHRCGEGIGGLLNATFGNAAELIIAIMALRAGMYDVVKASLTGSIIGNILLVAGAAFIAGGMRYTMQDFNVIGARNQATMLNLAAIALVIPAMYHYAVQTNVTIEAELSLCISLVLLVTYVLGLVFSLKTHKHLFTGSVSPEIESEDLHADIWPMKRAIIVLGVVTAVIAWMSEILVGSVEHTAHTFGMSSVFVGVIIVAIVGNAAEHSTAILVALKNRMDLSLGIAIGSSIQIALFVAPVLVILSYFIGPHPMDLVLTPLEVMAIFVSVHICGQIAGDGKSNWFEGLQLLTVYVLLGIVFFFAPDSHPATH